MDLIVVGAGVAGCAAAQRLRQLGHGVTVLEATDRVGGRAYTLREGRFAAEAGGDTLLGSYQETRRLLTEAGLAASLRSFDRASCLHDGGQAHSLRAGSPLGYATTSLLSLRDKVRLAAGYLRLSLRRPVDLFDDGGLPRSLGGRSLADWAGANFGPRALEYLVRPAVETRWYFPCEEIPAAYGLELIRRAPVTRFHCLAGGMEALLAALLSDVSVETGSAVTGLEPAPGGVRVRTRDGLHEADGVIVATEAPAAARILPSSHAPRRHLAECRYSRNIRVLVGYERDAWRRQRVTSVQPVGQGRCPVASVSLVSRKSAQLVPRGGEVVAVHFTGAASARLDDAAAIAAAREAIARFLPPAGQQPAFERLVRWDRALPVPSAARLQVAHAVRDGLPPRLGLAGDYFGLPTIETAVRSGRRAAERLHAAAA